MTMPAAVALCGNLLQALAIAAVRTTLVAVVAGLLLKSFRVKASATRLLAWKLVVLAGLAMPVLPLLLPAIRVSVPGPSSFLAPQSISINSAVSQTPAFEAPPVSPKARQIDSRHAGQTFTPARQTPHSVTDDLNPENVILFAFLVYASASLFLLSRILIGIAVARRLVQSATPINDSISCCSVGQVFRNIAVRESARVSVPVTVGFFKPTVLLPMAWRGWDTTKLHAVLTHELSHVARFDVFTQLASLVHRAMFWFSPLAWWLNRHVIELAEEVSDEAALSAGVERNQYARNLLAFFETLHTAPGRVHWQGVSMATSRHPEKRLEKILAWRGDTKMKSKKWMLVIITAIAISATCLIAAARPAQERPTATSETNAHGQRVASSEPSAPAMPGAPSMPAVSDASSMPSAPAMPAAASMPAMLAAPSMSGLPAVLAAPAPPPEPAGGNHRHGFFYSYGSDDEQRFVIVSGKMDSFTMSGSSEDARHAENLKKKISGDFIWFERDEKSYIIRDQATVDRARQLWAPQEELGKKQEELGKQQEALGKQQEELGARMGQVRVQVPDMTAELEKLKAELHELGPNATMEQIGKIQSEIGELQSKIGELQSHAGDAQGKIGDEMGILGEKQGKLGEQQGELGRQQGELAEKATKEMKKLLDDAIKNGTAKPEAEQPGGASL